MSRKIIIKLSNPADLPRVIEQLKKSGATAKITADDIRSSDSVAVANQIVLHDSFQRKTEWRIRKWDRDIDAPAFRLSPDAIEAERRAFERKLGPFEIMARQRGISFDDLLRYLSSGRDGAALAGVQRWANRRRADDILDHAGFADKFKPYEEVVFHGNLGLNSGIQKYEELLAGISAPTAWDNANARVATGTSAVAADPVQTALQAGAVFAAMNGSFPSRSGQIVSWQGTYTGGVANQVWAEFGIDNGAVGLVMLNRLVSAQGTKTAGQTWQLTLTITWS